MESGRTSVLSYTNSSYQRGEKWSDARRDSAEIAILSQGSATPQMAITRHARWEPLRPPPAALQSLPRATAIAGGLRLTGDRLRGSDIRYLYRTVH